MNGGFKTHLVVSFAGAAVTDDKGAFLLGDLYDLLGLQGSRHGSAQQIVVFINRVSLEGRVDEVGDEFFLYIQDVCFICASCISFLFYRIKVFLLTGVAADCDDFTIVIFL